MEKLKIQIIISSTRQGRFADQPAKWILERAKEINEFDVELLDLREYPLPFFDEPISPTMIKEPYANPIVAKWTKKVAEADGYIIVTAEYNHGYTAVLKNALDYVQKEWHQKPVAFVGYGTVGASRAIEQLREVAVELQMVPIRNAVHINAFWNLLDDKGNLKTESLEASAKAMLEQLHWWAKTLKPARNQK